jgi:hypothetical protein
MYQSNEKFIYIPKLNKINIPPSKVSVYWYNKQNKFTGSCAQQSMKIVDFFFPPQPVTCYTNRLNLTAIFLQQTSTPNMDDMYIYWKTSAERMFW